MDSSMSSRNLNARMTSDEMINKSTEWTLACDSALLNRLKDFSNNLVSQAEGIVKDCDNLSKDVDLLHSRVEGVTNDFLMLANTQYFENRVEEFEERNTIPPTPKNEEIRVKTKAEKEAELIGRMKEAIQIGLRTNTLQKDEDLTENHPGLGRRIQRSHIIGTPKFFSSRYCGLADENKLFPAPVPPPASSSEIVNVSDNNDGLSPPVKAGSSSQINSSNIAGPSNLSFRRQGSFSSDDLSFGKHSVSSNSVDAHREKEAGQVPSNGPVSSGITKPPTNFVNDLNNVFKTKVPPDNVESDSDDDFKPPPTGLGLGRKLFADAEENDDNDDIFGSSSLFPANRYIDNDDDDFFDPLPKPIERIPKRSPEQENHHTIPPVSNPIVHDHDEESIDKQPVDDSKESVPSSKPTIKTGFPVNPTLDFSAVINQIKSISKGDEASQGFKSNTTPSTELKPESEPAPVPDTTISKVQIQANSTTKTPTNPSIQNHTAKRTNQAKEAPPPTIVNIADKDKMTNQNSRTITNLPRQITKTSQRQSLQPPKNKVKPKHSIFDDSDSDEDIFSSASSSSSKLKNGSGGKVKDNHITASSRSLSSTGGGSSLFGGEDADELFPEKGSSNDSLPQQVNHTQKTKPASAVEAKKPTKTQTNANPSIQNQHVANRTKDNNIHEQQTVEAPRPPTIADTNKSEGMTNQNSRTITNLPRQISTQGPKPPKNKVKHSIFEDSDSDDDLFSTTSSKLKDRSGKKDSHISASSRSLSSTGGGSSLFGGEDADELFPDKRSSNDSLPQQINHTKTTPSSAAEEEKPTKTQTISKIKVRQSIFDESDSDDDLFSGKSKVGKKSQVSIFDEPSKKEEVKPISKPKSASVLFEDDDDDIFASKKTVVDSHTKTTRSSSVKSLGLSLNINPLALKPGSKPPTPTAQKVPSSFEQSPIDSDHLLTGVGKEEVKPISKPSALFDDEEDIFSSKKSVGGSHTISSTRSSGVKSLGLSLNINPLALKPGSKPPTPTVHEQSCEQPPIDSDNLLTGDGTEEVKPISKPKVASVLFEDDDDDDIFASKKTPEASRTNSTTRSSSVKSLGLSLNINPLALKPGSKPPTPTAHEVPSSFEQPPIDSDNLLTGVGKNRAKIKTARRPPTRKRRSDETIVEDPIFGKISIEVNENEISDSNILSKPPESDIEADTMREDPIFGKISAETSANDVVDSDILSDPPEPPIFGKLSAETPVEVAANEVLDSCILSEPPEPDVEVESSSDEEFRFQKFV